MISGEDFTQQQNIHINLASGPIPGVVFGQNEPMISHFHRELGKLTGVPDAPLPESFFFRRFDALQALPPQYAIATCIDGSRCQAQ